MDYLARMNCFSAVRCVALAMLFGGLFTQPLAACDTPVYRYAMYRWHPTPYEVYYFHRQPADEQNQQVHDLLRVAMKDNVDRCNVALLPVDLNEDEELVGVPPDVKQTWLAREDKATPAYLVVSPLGIKVYDGPLTKADLPSLLNSPTRAQLGQKLAEGNATVYLLLQTGDKQVDQQAEQHLKDLVESVAAGKLNLYSGPQDQFGPSDSADQGDAGKEGQADDQPQAAAPGHQVAYLTISRDDPKEKWLVRQLMAVEPDLHEFVDQPMVFAAYGRGRVLPPFIGKGVNPDNLVESVEFVTGACSCTVKEQNPGVDLLVQYDWDSASAALAEKYGSEEGNETQFGVDAFFPELVVGPEPQSEDQPSSPDAAGEPSETAVSAEQAASAEQGSSEQVAESAVQGGLSGPAESEAVARVEPPEDSDPVDETAAAAADAQAAAPERTEPPPADGASEAVEGQVAQAPQSTKSSSERVEATTPDSGVSSTMFFTIAVLIGVALFVLMAATLVMFRAG